MDSLVHHFRQGDLHKTPIFLYFSSLAIDERKLNKWIHHFYGYGSWSAPFWFIGYDETGGDVPEEVADKINYFHRAHPDKQPALCDVRELYENVSIYEEGTKGEKFKNRFEYRFGPEAVQHGVWKNLIAFMHGYRRKKVPDLLDYQKSRFLSPDAADAALISLYPLPSPHGHAWYYAWLDMPSMPFLKTRSAYETLVYPHRMRTLMEMMAKHQPELVLMFGMNNINHLKATVQAHHSTARFTQVKSVHRVTPQYHRAALAGTQLLMTTQIPSLRHNRVETGFDWKEFGRTVNASRPVDK